MYCYRFPDRAAFLTICDTLGWMTQDEEGGSALAAYTSDRAVDEVGPIVTTPGVYDEEGVEITPPVMDNGHHVNLIGAHPAEFDDYLVLVGNPRRQFAGGIGPSADPYAVVEETEE